LREQGNGNLRQQEYKSQPTGKLEGGLESRGARKMGQTTIHRASFLPQF
jgi:hypothetical protein